MLIAVHIMIALSCAALPSAASNEEQIDPPFAQSGGREFAPLHIGMRQKDVWTISEVVYWDYFTLVSSAQFAMADTAILDNGMRVTITYDEDHRVAAITTEDERARLHRGLGPGSTLKQLKERIPELELWRERGFAWHADAPELQSGELELSFKFDFDEPDPLRDDAKVSWVEIRPCDRIDWTTDFTDDPESLIPAPAQ